MAIPYDICVVGAGLIGSAAAKYASEDRALKVILIGPEDPMFPDDKRDIFGAHYDEARFTRSIAADPVWAVLNQRSIARYRDIEQRSGISFYGEQGFLACGTRNCEWTNNALTSSERDGIDVEYIDTPDQLQEHFQHLKFGDDDVGILERKDAGFINPRKLIAAQMVLALTQGCDIVRDIVSSIEKTEDGNGSLLMKLITDKGRVYHSRKVLLATGASTHSRNLLDRQMEMNSWFYLTTLVRCEVSDEDAIKLRGMPCVAYRGNGASSYWDQYPKNRDIKYTYNLVPPVKYPDGKHYVKISWPDPPTTVAFHGMVNRREMKEWYTGNGNRSMSLYLKELCKTLFTDIEILSTKNVNCAVVETPTGLPYIDMIHPNLGIFYGDNGYSAKSSDEMGLVAARMVVRGSWDHDLPAEKFKLIFKSSKNSKL